MKKVYMQPQLSALDMETIDMIAATTLTGDMGESFDLEFTDDEFTGEGGSRMDFSTLFEDL